MTDPLHIAFLHQDFPFSGAEQVTLSVANELSRNGLEVTILTPHHHEEAYPAGSQRLFRVVTLPEGNVKKSRQVADALCRIIRQESIGVLITYRQITYATPLKQQTGVKIVYELHNTPYYECLDIADKRRESFWANIFYGCGIERLLLSAYRAKYRRIYAWCDAFGLLCESYRQMLLHEVLGHPAEDKTWVLPNPIEPPERVEGEKEKLIVYVGRLSHRDKRVDRLLRIWQLAQEQLPQWRLEIIGNGKAAPKLKQQAVQLGLKNIHFAGYTNQVQRFYDRASILCLTSSFEGWPMCVAEAQANGVVPVLFNSFAGATDLVGNADEGVLVKPYDEQLFAQRLVHLATNESLLHHMQQAVRAKSLTYSAGRSAQAWMEMFSQWQKSR